MKSIEEKLHNLERTRNRIITLIAKELSTNQIVEKLFLGPATIETHRHNIIWKKLGNKTPLISEICFEKKIG
jgi:DNA-binding NarL/FixJ family response regulator